MKKIATLGMVIIFCAGLFVQTRPVLFTFAALNIGQGDAIYVETPSRQQIIMDGGPSSSVIQEMGSVMPLFDHSIDLMIISHPDADHITGLIDVVRRYHVGRVLLTGVVHHTAAYDLLRKEIVRKRIPETFVRAGDSFQLKNGVMVSILGPHDDWRNKETDDTNLTSIVAKVTYKNFSVLLTGDAPIAEEQEMLREQQLVVSTVLKVGHHGSRGSSSPAFLDAVHPAVAAISVGANNRYGHPTPEVLSLLKQRSIPTYRTDQFGRIIIQSNGETYHVSSHMPFRLW